MWLPLQVRKEYALKAFKMKEENPHLPFSNIARGMGLRMTTLRDWISKYVDPNFKTPRTGIILGGEPINVVPWDWNPKRRGRGGN